MSTERTCRKCGKDISHRHGKARQCEDCQGKIDDYYSEGNTCPICGVPVTNKSTFCRKHAHDKNGAILNRDKEIINRYLAGEKCIRLADEYHISRERVRQIIVKHGIKPPSKTTNHCPVCGVKCVGRIYCSKEHNMQHLRLSGGNKCIICGKPIVDRATTCNLHSCDPWKTNQIVTMYDDGLTQQQIADQLHANIITISRHIKLANRGRGKGHGNGQLSHHDQQKTCYVCGTPISPKATYCTKHQHDPWKVNAVISTRRQGMKLSEIADAVGLSTSHVSRILKTFGETRKSA
jgi:AraC-like DNA-binding protein